MSWIQHPLILEGQKVILVPLERKHFDGHAELAKNKDIWTWYHYDGTNKDTLVKNLEDTLTLFDRGEQYPFTVIDKLKGKIIGTTRFLRINPEFRNLEIGATWYNPDYWSKGYNEECKLLLLTYCFETLHCVRVQFTAWDKNLRSRKAIERIGAKFEGIMRNAGIRLGEVRSNACYSIIIEEWDEVKDTLQGLIKIRQATTV